jgi:glyoxylase-like metal-dependent hydrolase (beta-lactamase superfamily II)
MESVKLADYKNGIYCVDSGYEGGGVASVYIIRDGQSAAIIDTAHNGALEPVKRAMDTIGIASRDVEFIFLTHVHLDHAGGTGLFVKEFPNARVVVHERGARHIIDPEKLVSGAAAVYGEDEVSRLYGKVIPTPKDRITIPRDDDEFRVGERVIVCLDTPGHARHHLAYHDTSAGVVFTGDAYGMSYLELIRTEGRCAILTTSPVQFDPVAMRESMRKIESLKPVCVHPTHFGQMPIGGEISDSLHRQLDLYVKAAEDAEGDLDRIRTKLKELFVNEASRQGCPSLAANSGRVTGQALELNAQGLAVWYEKNKNSGHKLA